ncbi:hypothetical protein AVEN_249060-1 [Araneus ventricosus]|uniref:Uncharacterized protein n=1 Tax=Araneus ventricosus TaxID=182803 RepID=A0A4Y2P9G5_ARAVE|nr:hypothetical protein AVEN_249060-1 [Araneus ventricosus]
MANVQQKAHFWFQESKLIVRVQRIIRLENRNCQSPGYLTLTSGGYDDWFYNLGFGIEGPRIRDSIPPKFCLVTHIAILVCNKVAAVLLCTPASLQQTQHGKTASL